MPPSTKSKRSMPASTSKSPKQQHISAMLGERVTKPRVLSDGVLPPLKRQKMDESSVDIQPPPAHPSQSPSCSIIQAQKRKHRLSEILKKERESRLQRSQGAPAFIFQPPHMDTRRPQSSTAFGGLPPKQPVNTKTEAYKAASFWSGDEKEGAKESVRRINCSYNVTADAPGTRTHGAAPVPGGEALLYSRSMLPVSHQQLLDVLTGIETAVSLLKTRKTLPTIASIGEIVRRSTRRECNLRIISQLAHIVPEAIAVLPGLPGCVSSKRPSGSFILRLDDVNQKDETELGKKDSDSNSKVSTLGTCAARLRRSLLHNRLLGHVRENHMRFLRQRGIKNHNREVWHSDFNLERHVPELPAPPLYPVVLDHKSKESSEKSTKASEDTEAERSTAENVLANEDMTCAALDEKSESADDEDDGCIPHALLEKVRARKRTRELHESKAEEEKITNTSLLSKLPCTMDTICTVLRGERRSAMGWSQLLDQVGKVHPRKWPKEDLDKQFIAITTLGSTWCKRVELKSSRGGYAFRVVSESNFAKARAAVCATKIYTLRSE